MNREYMWNAGSAVTDAVKAAVGEHIRVMRSPIQNEGPPLTPEQYAEWSLRLNETREQLRKAVREMNDYETEVRSRLRGVMPPPSQH